MSLKEGFQELYGTTPPAPSPKMRKPSLGVTLGSLLNIRILAAIGTIVLLVAILPSFLHTYNERAHRFAHHRDVLMSGYCDNYLRDVLRERGDFARADIVEKIHITSMRYRDLQTNCGESLLYIQQSKFFGAVDDWFTQSTIYSLLTASTWQLQVVFAITFILTTIIMTRSVLTYMLRSNAMSRAFDTIKASQGNYAVIMDKNE